MSLSKAPCAMMVTLMITKNQLTSSGGRRVPKSHWEKITAYRSLLYIIGGSVMKNYKSSI